MDESKQFSLSKKDWQKIFTGSSIAIVGAILTWATAELIPLLNTRADEAVEHTDRLGLLIAAAVVSAAVNAVRKWLTDHRKPHVYTMASGKARDPNWQEGSE